MNLKKSFVTAAAVGSVLLFGLAPLAYADNTIEVSGNGSGSDNSANVTSTNTNTVSQSNDATVNNKVNSNTNTGGNTASGNTGGNVSVDTGNASSTTDVSTQANVNQASTPNCNCSGSTNVLVGGNGSGSSNSADVSNNNSSQTYQTNSANIKNNVTNNSNTGYNRANDNTGSIGGGGNVTIRTGDSSADTTIYNKANANILTSSGAGAGSGSGDISAKILGNGAFSDNNIDLSNNNSATVVQDNQADSYNNVRNNQNTGKNSASDNTGMGSVRVDTGMADSSTNIDNLANFNSADIDCGCVTGVTAKILGNGSWSDNSINAALNNDNQMFQTNDAYLNNRVNNNGNTGKNYANDNTGSVLGIGVGDPSTNTGDSSNDTTVHNSTNVNQLGNGGGITLPGGGSLNLSFDMSGLLHFLGLM